MTQKLSNQLAKFGEIAARIQKCQSELARIRQERDATIEAASGPDDAAALEKLSVLASQESLVARQLQLAQRERDGQSAALLNEATGTRSAAMAALCKRRAALESKLADQIAEFYPTVKGRRSAIASLRPHPPAIWRCNKLLDGLAAQQYTPGKAGSVPGCNTEEGFARSVLRMAERAVAECLD